MDDEILMTADEVATFCRTSTARVYNLISEGQEGIKIPNSISVGRRRLWLKSDVIAWAKSLRTVETKNTQIGIKNLAPRIRKI